MNTAPNENIKLTVEQLQQIEFTQNKLATIQTEITSASKTLNQIKAESTRATKEREYEEELLKEMLVKSASAKTQHESLVASIEEGKTTLDTINKESSKIKKSQEQKSMELKDREDTLSKKETSYTEMVNNLNNKEKKISEDALAIENVKSILKSAIESAII